MAEALQWLWHMQLIIFESTPLDDPHQKEHLLQDCACNKHSNAVGWVRDLPVVRCVDRCRVRRRRDVEYVVAWVADAAPEVCNNTVLADVHTHKACDLRPRSCVSELKASRDAADVIVLDHPPPRAGRGVEIGAQGDCSDPIERLGCWVEPANNGVASDREPD